MVLRTHKLGRPYPAPLLRFHCCERFPATNLLKFVVAVVVFVGGGDGDGDGGGGGGGVSWCCCCCCRCCCLAVFVQQLGKTQTNQN